MNRRPRFQFDLSTLMTWMVVISVMCAVGIQMPMGVGVLILGLPLLFIPILVAAFRQASQRIEFSSSAQVALTCFVIGHSMLMFALSALLGAEWKGTKGFHWSYYLLDGMAGVAWWPLFFWGAWMFLKVAVQERSKREMQLAAIGLTSNCLIAVYYVYACAMLNFAGNSSEVALLIWAPFSAAVCYGLFGATLIRRLRTMPDDGTHLKRYDIGFLAAAWTALTTLKIALAVRYYDALPDQPPQGCFVVSAASRGHRHVVRSWYDQQRGKWVNHQLLTMWRFEAWLQQTAPRFHAWLRRHYNHLGPLVAHASSGVGKLT